VRFRAGPKNGFTQIARQAGFLSPRPSRAQHQLPEHGRDLSSIPGSQLGLQQFGEARDSDAVRLSGEGDHVRVVGSSGRRAGG
jgi:hypothetical protein